MDWIKVKVSHVLYEYTDLSPNEGWAWIKIMALTAIMEKAPTEDVLRRHINGRTLKSLERKLNEHRTSIELVVNKVLEDVEYTRHLRAKNKSKIAEWRRKTTHCNQLHEPVTLPVTLPDKIREDKIREDKKKIPIQPLKRLVGVYSELKGISAEDVTNNYSRLAKAAKNLYLAAGENIDAAEKTLRDGAEYYSKKKLSWKLETISKNYAEINAGEADPYADIK